MGFWLTGSSWVFGSLGALMGFWLTGSSWFFGPLGDYCGYKCGCVRDGI